DVTEDTDEAEDTADNQEEDMDEDDMEPASEEDLEEAEKVADYSQYEELQAQDVFNPTDYEGHLVTDNQGTRVFIFRSGDEQAYKTVFVKHDKRLKVIDLKQDQLVLNEIIK